MALTDDTDGPEASGSGQGADAPRQKVVRVAGARRAKLTAAPGATSEPAPRDEASDSAPAPVTDAPGPNDDRLRRDVPPHY